MLGPSALAVRDVVDQRCPMDHILNPRDEALQDAVEAALRQALGPDGPHIGVAAEGGTVTLTGHVPTYNERTVAHATTLGVPGVHAVAEDLLVRDARSTGETDTELAKAAQVALRRAVDVPPDSVIAEVSDHVVTLTGHVRSSGERIAAERAVIYLPGLTRINNRVEIHR